MTASFLSSCTRKVQQKIHNSNKNMITTFPIKDLLEAISEAEHKDPAYEPGRSTSSVKTVEIETKLRFNPRRFRTIINELGFKIRDVQTSPLILVKTSGECGFGATPLDKDSLVAKFDPKGDLLLWAWCGQFRTDVFVLSKEDLDKYYA
jgi:hypothetical protein